MKSQKILLVILAGICLSIAGCQKSPENEMVPLSEFNQRFQNKDDDDSH